MKKIILVILIAVMIATPCFAQEIEPEGMFSVDETYWDVWGIGLFISIPSHFIIHHDGISFHQGFMNSVSSPEYGSSGYFGYYLDLGVVSIACGIFSPGYFFLAIMQPTLGFGVFTVLEFQPLNCGKGFCAPPYFRYETGIMVKKICTCPGYTEQASYIGGGCGAGSGFTCIGYSDGYIWRVEDGIRGWREETCNGQPVHVAIGYMAEYYHVLNSNCVK